MSSSESGSPIEEDGGSSIEHSSPRLPAYEGGPIEDGGSPSEESDGGLPKDDWLGGAPGDGGDRGAAPTDSSSVEVGGSPSESSSPKQSSTATPGTSTCSPTPLGGCTTSIAVLTDAISARDRVITGSTQPGRPLTDAVVSSTLHAAPPVEGSATPSSCGNAVSSVRFANCLRLTRHPLFFCFFGAPTTDVHQGACAGSPSTRCSTNEPTSLPISLTACRRCVIQATTPMLAPFSSPSFHRIHDRDTPGARPTTHSHTPSSSTPTPTAAKLHASVNVPLRPEPPESRHAAAKRARIRRRTSP